MDKYLTFTWNRIAVFLAACTLVAVMSAIGANDANAARVVGRVDAPGVSATSGTNIMRVTLSPRDPDDDSSSASGSISGMTIHLERSKGILPSDPQDREKVENATTAELAEWPEDLRFSQVIGENGFTKFSDLPEGIYLVTSTAPNGSYREVNSFLVSVPFYDAGYDSTPVGRAIVAKSHKPGETPPPSVPPTTPPETPPTTPPETPPTTPRTSTPSKTPPMTPTAPTAPGKPGISTTTSTTSTIPGESDISTPSDLSGSSSSSGGSGRSGSLALTGVQVAGLVAVTVALIGEGFIIIAASKKNSESGKN